MLLKLLRGAFARRPGLQPLQTGGEPPQAVVDRSRALQRSREFDAAGAMIEGLLERDGGAFSARARADLLIEAGLCRLRQFRLDEASRHFESARRVSPGHPLAERIGQFPQLICERMELRREPLLPVGPARSRQDGLTAVYFYLDVPGVPARDRQAYAELLRRSVRSLKAAVPGARAALITDLATEVAGTIGFDDVFRQDLSAGELVYGRLVALSRLPGSQGMDGNLVLLDPDTQVLRDFSAIFSLEFDLGFTLRSDFVEAAMDHEPINVGVIFVRAAGAARARGFFQRCVERFPEVENRPAVRRFYPDGLRAWRGDQVLPAAVVGWREFIEYVLSGRTDRMQVEDCAIAFFESSLYNCSEPSAATGGGGEPYIVHHKGQRKVQVLEESAAERP